MLQSADLWQQLEKALIIVFCVSVFDFSADAFRSHRAILMIPFD